MTGELRTNSSDWSSLTPCTWYAQCYRVPGTEPTLSSLTGTVTGVARRRSFHRAFDSDRGGLYQIAYPKAESPGGGMDLKAKPLSQWPKPETILTDQITSLGFVGVERWVGRLAGDLGPGVP